MNQIIAALLDFLAIHPWLALGIVFLVAFGEALLIVGLFVPSTPVILGAGALIGMGKLAFFPMLVCAAAGAIAGDALSFWIGRVGKQRIRTAWPFRNYASLMKRGDAFFALHGGKSIFIVRFVPLVKAVVPTIAGMAGMSPARFAIFNVVSAIVWAAVHLVPGMLLGRGIKIANAANPRLLLVLGFLLITLLAAWFATRFLLRFAMPLADRWRNRLTRWLMTHPSPALQQVGRVLSGTPATGWPYAFAGLCLLAFSGFVMLVLNLISDPALARSDAAISSLLQSLQSEPVTRLMVGVTMLGDTLVLFPLALLLIAAVLAGREWRVAAAVTTTIGAAALFVPLAKSLLHRARPIPLYGGADAFSFPSGHSTLATVILGVLALCFAHSVPPRVRHSIFALTALIVMMIAVSRVYLLAHWPSDVLAGLLFGVVLVFGLALYLHDRPLRIPLWAIIGTFVATLTVLVPLHLSRNYAMALAQYSPARVPVTLTGAEWLAQGWRDQPAARILLDGDYGEAMVVQTDLSADAILAGFTAAGWTLDTATRVDALTGPLIPSRAALLDHASWPLTHIGKPPVASLVRLDPTDPALRSVLRLWGTETLIDDGTVIAPLLMMTGSRERLDPLAFGWSMLEQTIPSQADATFFATEVASVLAPMQSATGALPLRISR